MPPIHTHRPRAYNQRTCDGLDDGAARLFKVNRHRHRLPSKKLSTQLESALPILLMEYCVGIRHERCHVGNMRKLGGVGGMAAVPQLGRLTAAVYDEGGVATPPVGHVQDSASNEPSVLFAGYES